MKMKHLDEGKPVEGIPGIFRKTLAYDDEAMLCHFELSQGSSIPLHSHRAAQVGYVLKGRVRFLAEKPEDEFEVRPGDSYVFSADVVHGADVLADSEFIEVFTPSRDEYKDF